MLGRKVWRDGKIIPSEEALVSSLAHSMQRGSLVFDVLSFHDGARGVAIFRLREHVVRFLRSASIVGMEIGYSEEELCAATCTAVRETGLRDGLIRMSGYFGSIESDLVPMDARGTVVISAYARTDLPKRPSSTALKIQIPEIRKAAPDAIPPLAKVAASYLGPMIARRSALADGFDEIVLCDHTGSIAEAPTANVFAGIGGQLVTPPLGAILDGITRDTVMMLAREEGIPVVERALSPAELRSADEAFLTATSYVVAPIGSVDRQEMKAPGPLTTRLRARVAETFAGERWLTPIGGGRRWAVRLREELYAVGDRVLAPGERGEASEGRAAQVYVLDVEGLEVVTFNVFRLSASEKAKALSAVKARFPNGSIVQFDGAGSEATAVAGVRGDERQAAALAYLAVVMSWEERPSIPISIDGRTFVCTHDGRPQKEWSIVVA
ncbi:MAG: aminotransferase class IV [Polyangiales bacterium]